MNDAKRPKTTPMLLLMVLIMLVLHQDFWYWHDESLWFGFIPSGLGYQAGFSLAAACLWAWAMKFAWPAHVEAMAED